MVAPNASLLQQLEEVEHQALSLIMGAVRGRRAASHAICVVMLALPTLQCELDRGMIRLILRVLALPSASMFRCYMVKLCARWHHATVAERQQLQETWWGKTQARLQHLDALDLQYDNACPYVRRQPQLQLADTIDKLLLSGFDAAFPKMSGREAATALKRISTGFHYMTDWAAWEAHRAAFSKRSSLAATLDLLRHRGCDGRLPFLSQTRSTHQKLLLNLPAGTYHLLGHSHWDASCPWCLTAGAGAVAISIPHLLRDCIFWAGQRRVVVLAVHALAMAMGPGIMTQDALLSTPDAAVGWYFFMAGHPVPLGFLNLPVFPSVADGAIDRFDKCPAPEHVALQQYNRLLDLSVDFVVMVLAGTQRVFRDPHAYTMSGGQYRVFKDLGGENVVPASGQDEEARRAQRRALRHAVG
jgi:hypothetical protein